VPGGRQGTRFSFSISNDGRDNKVGIVECGATGVREDVSEFASFMD